MCVLRASVTRVIPGQTHEPIEFILGRYLPLDNGNLHPKVGPLTPREELWGPKFWVLWEVWANFEQSR